MQLTISTKTELFKGMNGTLSGDDVREGLTAVISVKVPNPQFEGQTKIKLNNPEVKVSSQELVRDELLTYFEEHPQDAKNIIARQFSQTKLKLQPKLQEMP